MTSQDRVAFTQAGIEIVIAETARVSTANHFGLGTSDIPDREVREEGVSEIRIDHPVIERGGLKLPWPGHQPTRRKIEFQN